MQATAAPTLYQRLGGYDVIAAFTDQWLGLVLGDPLLAPYFRGMSNDTKGRARQLIVDFIAGNREPRAGRRARARATGR